MKRVLVTGGLGFLGSHLVDALIHDPEVETLCVVDHGESGVTEAPLLLASWEATGKLRHASESVDSYCRLPLVGPWHEIYHLASPVGPVGVLASAGEIAEQIVGDALAIARCAEREDARLLFVSTSEIYGGGMAGLCGETMPSRIGPPRPSPRLEYAVGKLAAEVALLNRIDREALDVVIVRPFNITGPRQLPRGGFVLPRFILQGLLGLPLTVYGDGRQERAFTHVRDIVWGLMCAMERGVRGGVYNLGNAANRCTIQQLAEEVAAGLPEGGKITHVDPGTLHGPRFEEAADKFPDPTRTAAEIGWQASLDRVTILADTRDYWLAQGEEECARWRKWL